MSLRIPPGTLAMFSGELTRYAECMLAWRLLQVPDGAVEGWGRGVRVERSINRAILAMQGDWFFIMGDDHTFPPDLLLRMLERMYRHDLDVLVPLCADRKPPFNPVIYRRAAELQADTLLYAPLGWGEIPKRSPRPGSGSSTAIWPPATRACSSASACST